jgi:PHS family inorganic phosphate transporter-like MFS transporter
MLTGIGSTLLLKETKGQSLEQLSGEDQDGFVQAHARDTSNLKPVVTAD